MSIDRLVARGAFVGTPEAALGDLRLAFVDRTPSAEPPQRIPVDLQDYILNAYVGQCVLFGGDTVNINIFGTPPGR